MPAVNCTRGLSHSPAFPTRPSPPRTPARPHSPPPRRAASPAGGRARQRTGRRRRSRRGPSPEHRQRLAAEGGALGRGERAEVARVAAADAVQRGGEGHHPCIPPPPSSSAPPTEKASGSWARGTRRPSASTTSAVTYARSSRDAQTAAVGAQPDGGGRAGGEQRPRRPAIGARRRHRRQVARAYGTWNVAVRPTMSSAHLSPTGAPLR